MTRRSRSWRRSASVRVTGPAAQNRLGSAHWAKSRDLERRGDAAAAQAEAQKAIDVLERRAQGPPRRGRRRRPIPAWSATSATWRPCSPRPASPPRPSQLLDPIVKAQTVKSGPGIRAADRGPAQGLYHLGQGRAGDRLDEGPRAVRRSRAAGPSFTSSWASFWKRSSTRSSKRNNTTALARMHQAYKTFLTTLAESKTGQSYDSLQWAGEGLLDARRLSPMPRRCSGAS